MRALPFIIILLNILCNHKQLKAQGDVFNDVSLSTNYHIGYSLPEYQMMNYYTNSYVQSFDFCIGKQSTGENYWEQLFNYPEYGVSLFYSSLGNDDIFGREFAINSYFKVPFLVINKFSLYNRMGIGLDYVTEKFNQNTNPYNTAIGSSYNIHYNCRLGANLKISQKLGVNAGISFDHFSNANTGVPNLGINYVTSYTGINYMIGTESPKQTHEIPEHKRASNFEVFASFGGKHTRALTSDYFFTSSTSIDYRYKLFRSIHFCIGLDLFYDSSVKKQLIDLEREFKTRYLFQSGAHISQTFVYNNLSLTIQEGLYMILKEEIEHYTMYNRAILRYQLPKLFYVQFTMKTHLHILDYPEIGIGVKL